MVTSRAATPQYVADVFTGTNSLIPQGLGTPEVTPDVDKSPVDHLFSWKNIGKNIRHGISKLIPDPVERGICRSAMGFLMAMTYVPFMPKRFTFSLCKSIESIDAHIHDIPMTRAHALYAKRINQSKSFGRLLKRMVKSPMTSCTMITEELARNVPALAATFLLATAGMQFVAPAAAAVGALAAVQAFGETNVRLIDNQDADNTIRASELYRRGNNDESRKQIFNASAKNATVIGVSTSLTFAAGVALDHVFGTMLPKNASFFAGKAAGVVEREVSLKAVAGVIDVAAGYTEQKAAILGSHSLADRTTAIVGGVIPGLVI